VTAISVNGGQVQVSETVAMNIEQLVPECKRWIDRRHVGDIEAKAGFRKRHKAIAQLRRRVAAALTDVHIRDGISASERAESSTATVEISAASATKRGQSPRRSRMKPVDAPTER
jgi:hypothetical protein